MGKITPQIVPDTGLQRQIMSLAVAPPEAGEDTDDLAVPLGPENLVMGAEAVGIGDVRRLDIARYHCLLELRRYVAPGVLEQRDQVVGRMARQRILEIEQPEVAPIGEYH